MKKVTMVMHHNGETVGSETFNKTASEGYLLETCRYGDAKTSEKVLYTRAEAKQLRDLLTALLRKH